MRPLYHKKADRLRAKADRLEKEGAGQARSRQSSAANRSTSCSARASRTSSWASAVKTTRTRPSASPITKPSTARSPMSRSSTALVAVLRQDAFNHHDLQAIDGRQRQRHERHVHGRQHRLQHGLWLDAAVQSASVSVDELAVPGRRDHQLAPGRIADHESRPALRGAGTARRRAARARRRTSLSEADYFTLTHLDDALMTDQEIRELPKVWVIGGDGALGRHRFPERFEGHPAEPAEREDADARHAGVFQHRRPELRLLHHARRLRHEPVRRRLAGQADREEERRRSLHQRPRLAVCRAGLDGQRRQALQGDARRPGISRHRVLPVLHHLPAGARRGRQHVAPTRPRWFAMRAACRSSSSIRAAAKPRRKPST